MNRDRANQNRQCAEIEALLIQEHDGVCDPDATRRIEAHVATCPRCRSLRALLPRIQAHLESDLRTAPQPRRETREYLLRRMRNQRPLNETRLAKYWQAGKRALEYRIPVYQAVALVAILLLLINLAPALLWHEKLRTERATELVFAEAPKAIQMQTLSDLEMMRWQKIGRNAIEDSAIIHQLMKL
jgi:anti-sigma factor RsiW